MLRKNDANRWISAGIGFSATPSAEVNELGVLADVGDVGTARQRPEPRLLHREQRRQRPVPAEAVTGAQLRERLVALGEGLAPEVV